MLYTSSVSIKNFFEKTSKKILIPEDRKIILLKIAETVALKYTKNEVVNLLFMCSQNSRRSQFGQVWSFFAAHYFELNINAFSGGNEVTCFNRSTIKTLQKAGFYFQLSDFSHQNPKYEITFDGAKKQLIGFSKLVENESNPKNCIVITTCSEVEKNCPYLPNATHLFYLPFEDPKRADGILRQEEIYMEISNQIAGEIFVIFKEVKQRISSPYLL